MANYTLVHVGINGADAEEARKGAERFQLLFGLPVKEGNSSVFAGTEVEIMKSPYKGTHGHIGLGTPDVAAARAELEAKGCTFDDSTAKYDENGALKFVYLAEEICGFAVHLIKK